MMDQDGLDRLALDLGVDVSTLDPARGGLLASEPRKIAGLGTPPTAPAEPGPSAVTIQSPATIMKPPFAFAAEDEKLLDTLRLTVRVAVFQRDLVALY